MGQIDKYIDEENNMLNKIHSELKELPSLWK